jgi:nucleotide-binding universal stress UspA family protein
VLEGGTTRAVVAGVDLTAMGRRVAERARIIAEESGASLNLVYVVEPVAEALIEPSLARLMRDRQTAAAEDLAEWCRGRSSVEVNLDVVKGSPSWELVARSKIAHLVVVGSSTIDAFTVGPTARRVARKAASHTLLVRRQPRVPYRRIIVTVDFSDASRVGVDTALAMFPGAEITVLYSLTSRFDQHLTDAGLFSEELDMAKGRRLEMAADRMAEFVHGWGQGISTMIADGPTLETIEEAVRRRNADLVVVSSRGATATRMVLLGTVAEGLLEAAPCDVLVARVKSSFRRP